MDTWGFRQGNLVPLPECYSGCSPPTLSTHLPPHTLPSSLLGQGDLTFPQLYISAQPSSRKFQCAVATWTWLSVSKAPTESKGGAR